VAKKPQKPTLTIAPGRGLTVEELVELFKRLTGRTPSPEEVEEARAKLEGGRPAGTTPAPPAAGEGEEARPS
jgi:hypothetical protein